MAGQRGRDILLKLVDASGALITVAGIRTRTLEFSVTAVDGTHSQSPEAWRELVTGAGVKSARVRGSGVFKDTDSDARMREIFFSGDATEWALMVPGFGSVRGLFLITELTYAGDHDGEATFSVTLESAGLLAFEGLA